MGADRLSGRLFPAQVRRADAQLDERRCMPHDDFVSGISPPLADPADEGVIVQELDAGDAARLRVGIAVSCRKAVASQTEMASVVPMRRRLPEGWKATDWAEVRWTFSDAVSCQIVVSQSLSEPSAATVAMRSPSSENAMSVTQPECRVPSGRMSIVFPIATTTISPANPPIARKRPSGEPFPVVM